MTPGRFILASLWHYRRIHLAVALGVAVATAVLSGALLVGDSVRGSLRDLTLQRLGRIDSAMVAPHLFRAELAIELDQRLSQIDPAAAGASPLAAFQFAEPALLTSGTLQSGSGGDVRRATGVSVVGCRESFWRAGEGGPSAPLAASDVAITEALASELGVGDGDSILLRLEVASAIPSDSPLGEKTDLSRARRLQVASVLPAEGVARFGLAPSQHQPRNLFLPIETLQQLIEQPGKANAILVATGEVGRSSDLAAQQALQQSLRPRLADLGLVAEEVESPARYVQIAAQQLVLPDTVVEAAERAFGPEQLQPVVTYLANTLRAGSEGALRKIPYSTISGVDSTAELGPVLDEQGQPIMLADDEIALNRWAADNLGVAVGDTVTVTFYEPESTHGQLREHEPPPAFRLRAIAELERDGGPTPAADPRLTPELPGVTDQDSISDWDLPFELVETIRSEDETYWDEFRTTPKAFVSLATAERLWPSRWGTISLLRLPLDAVAAEGTSETAVAEDIERRLLGQLDPADLGMAFQPVKAQGLAAAQGTTPFDGLFLGFSLFLIAAAVMLIALLFQLGIQQRAAELGILGAVGVGRRRIVRLLAREGLVVAAVGAAAGLLLGVGYAWLMIAGLRTWWVAAVATPFLELHVTPRSLAVGWIVGVLVSWLTIRWSAGRLVRRPAGQLLAGQIASRHVPASSARLWPVLRWVMMLAVVLLGGVGFTLGGEAQAGVFFGSGAAALVLLLGEIRYRLRAAGGRPARQGTFRLASLSRLNTARNPGRATLTIGLVASASFLMIAISAFRLDADDAGTGGFELLATSDRPIRFDLDTPAGRLDLGFADADSDALAHWRIFSLRVAAGEDASCLNLYRPAQPRMLGVPDALVERSGFVWAGVQPLGGERPPANPWTLLRGDLGRDEAGRPIVPVLLDANTATYSLHLSGVGATLEIRDSADRPTTLQVVGLLKNSLLQGSLMVSEANFLQLYPDAGGYRFFLVERRPVPADGAPAATDPVRAAVAAQAGAPPLLAPAPSAEQVAGMLESTLGLEGFDAVDARQRLAGYLAVQNTYLSTFQSLGALGLLLGTIGLAIVQLRSVLERRGELALMRAGGFRRRRLMRMVVGENAVLLLGGLAVGSVAAAVATLPQWARQATGVPWLTLAVLLGLIAVVGIAAGWLATQSALRAPILPALRGD